jgi:molybdopterin converting factor small subunit
MRAVVTIELFGVPRMRAGVDQVKVEAASIGEALRALAEACPVLGRGVVREGALSPSYMIAVNGLQMTADPRTELRDGDVLVLLSADAGG